jgi:hypothetical protein
VSQVRHYPKGLWNFARGFFALNSTNNQVIGALCTPYLPPQTKEFLPTKILLSSMNSNPYAAEYNDFRLVPLGHNHTTLVDWLAQTRSDWSLTKLDNGVLLMADRDLKKNFISFSSPLFRLFSQYQIDAKISFVSEAKPASLIKKKRAGIVSEFGYTSSSPDKVRGIQLYSEFKVGYQHQKAYTYMTNRNLTKAMFALQKKFMGMGLIDFEQLSRFLTASLYTQKRQLELSLAQFKAIIPDCLEAKSSYPKKDDKYWEDEARLLVMLFLPDLRNLLANEETFNDFASLPFEWLKQLYLV